MIRLDRAVTLLLPFDRYRLTLSHRLLDTMGSVSRFLLKAIEQELSLAALIEITGLSDTVLLNQLAYLEAHNYVRIESDNGPLLWLTSRGASIVRVERLLEDSQLNICLDAFTLSRQAVHMVMFDQSLPFSPPVPADDDPSAIIVRVPRRPGRTGKLRRFDDANRLRLVMEQNGLKQLLEYCWGTDCELISSELEHWTFELGDAEHVEQQVSVDYEAGELLLYPKMPGHQGKPDALPPFTLPVIELAHAFKKVEGFPWEVDLPLSRVQRFELVSAGALNQIAGSATIVEGGDTRHCKLPIGIGPGLPSELVPLTVPPGVCVEASARMLHLSCSMDEIQLSLNLQHTSDALVISHNLVKETEELA